MYKKNFHLISHVLCPYVQRSVIVLKEKDIPYTRTDIDLDKPPIWFEQISPMGKVPVLSVSDDISDEITSLFESAVICEYLDEITPGTLHPVDPLKKAHHRAWIEFGSGILGSIAGLYSAKNAQDFETKRIEILTKFQLLEKQIMGKFFSGEHFHLIDAVYGPIFTYFDVFDDIIDLKIFINLPKINDWRRELRQRPSIQSAVITEYPELLVNFLKNKDSYLSQLMSQ